MKNTMLTAILAIFWMATSVTVTEANEPQPGQTVNAFDGDGNAVSGTVLQYSPHVRNGQNPRNRPTSASCT